MFIKSLLCFYVGNAVRRNHDIRMHLSDPLIISVNST